MIYDGKAPIARFRQRGGNDLAFREVALQRGGRPLIWWLPVWWSQHANLAANLVDDLVVDDSNPEKLEIMIPPSPNPTGRIHLILQQKGKDKSWFSHVDFNKA
ncbi:MAG: hypothetical protein KJ964_10925 [Verrucomicrobia bacterium]|nr:hypothetical protein [Verrucomicrobiota bacterium]MBU1735404.1 hypothetical protein [Verrucomicrobiota bacterium]MBU1857441.1 hypothetical protein [Verrucomicrobiota bacterium]